MLSTVTEFERIANPRIRAACSLLCSHLFFFFEVLVIYSPEMYTNINAILWFTVVIWYYVNEITICLIFFPVVSGNISMVLMQAASFRNENLPWRIMHICIVYLKSRHICIMDLKRKWTYLNYVYCFPYLIYRWKICIIFI